MDRIYPVFVRENETGDLMVFGSENELQYLEKVDVDAGEFQCWNALGEACSLSGDSKEWISARSAARANPWTLNEALQEFARRNEIDPGPVLTASADPIQAIARLQAIIESRKRPSIVDRLRVRLFSKHLLFTM